MLLIELLVHVGRADACPSAVSCRFVDLGLGRLALSPTECRGPEASSTSETLIDWLNCCTVSFRRGCVWQIVSVPHFNYLAVKRGARVSGEEQ
jgi:hypothetical protein